MEIPVNGETKVYGIIGYPVKHSKSPQFQTAAFLSLKINGIYLPFEVKPEDLRNAVSGIKALSIKGVNVTVPHKEEIVKYLDEISQEVQYIGASNTIKNIDGYLIGYNTDAYGFIEGLKEILPEPHKKNFLIIGAGGASRAVLYGLINEGVQNIIVANRTVERVYNIIEDFKTLNRFIDQIIQPVRLDQIEENLNNVDVIVNTTSVGLKDEDPPLFDYSKIKKDHIVVDIIYKKTKLLKEAEKKGCLYQDGLPMLLYQGAKAFEIWTERKAPIGVMREVLQKK